MKYLKIILLLFLSTAVFGQEALEASNSSAQAATSLWGFLTVAFLAGFGSIFMPCIYPIMPMTVSFFTKQANGIRKAVFYGLSIMIIFGIIGLIAKVVGAPFFNFLSTHWIPNLIFFVIFILFGISLLGAFEIVLPHETVNKIDRMSEKGGLIGIFFMALTLVVVSFSCTAPFVGSLLIESTKGEVWRPVWGMLAFGLPFALVFTTLAMFPQLLKSLPKSGGWMNEMKAVFGILEFALALKFLSNIDLAYHFNTISQKTFLIVWIVLFAIIGIYILGILRLPKDSKVKKYSVQRIGFALLFFAFTAYMVPGVTHGKDLDLLGGILPPKHFTSSIAGQQSDIIHGIKGFHNYDEAVAYAKEVNKPIFIDFTGYNCANCRLMEQNVWKQTEVLEKLKNDFVIASLYIDDKEKLPQNKQYKSTYDGETITTIGERNMDIEITKYNNNAQPYYAIEDLTGKTITQKNIGYTSKDEFLKFLNEGLGNFKK